MEKNAQALQRKRDFEGKIETSPSGVPTIGGRYPNDRCAFEWIERIKSDSLHIPMGCVLAGILGAAVPMFSHVFSPCSSVRPFELIQDDAKRAAAGKSFASDVSATLSPWWSMSDASRKALLDFGFTGNGEKDVEMFVGKVESFYRDVVETNSDPLKRAQKQASLDKRHAEFQSVYSVFMGTANMMYAAPTHKAAYGISALMAAAVLFFAAEFFKNRDKTRRCVEFAEKIRAAELEYVALIEKTEAPEQKEWESATKKKIEETRSAAFALKMEKAFLEIDTAEEEEGEAWKRSGKSDGVRNLERVLQKKGAIISCLQDQLATHHGVKDDQVEAAAAALKKIDAPMRDLLHVVLNVRLKAGDIIFTHDTKIAHLKTLPKSLGGRG